MIDDDFYEAVSAEEGPAIAAKVPIAMASIVRSPHPREKRIIFKNIDRDGLDGRHRLLPKGWWLRRSERGRIGMTPDANRQRGQDFWLARPRRRRFSLRSEVGIHHDPARTKPVYLICNADESEPGTFKDRYIIHQDPHQLLEGMIISCYAVNARLAYIYIRGEFPLGAKILERAIAEAEGAAIPREEHSGQRV